MPYYYACPYCEQVGGQSLVKGKLEIVKDFDHNCDHKKGFFDKNKECRKEDFACKGVYECTHCSSRFANDKEFLKEQKRKDKDG